MSASTITYGAELNVLVSVRGHPFERDHFAAIFDDMEGVAATFVDQPAASQLMTPGGLSSYDVLCLYDMPGIDFDHADLPGFVTPESSCKSGLKSVLQQGKGIVALHHAIAGWPAWPEYGDWLGGRFLYRPDSVRGAACSDSGYRHDVTHTIQREEMPDPLFEPLFEEIPEEFSLTDELYLAQVFEQDVVPLLRSDFQFEHKNFYSAKQAVAGEMFSRDGWTHPSGSNLVAWAKAAERSPLIYIQFGDGPETYANPIYRQLIENALRWAASKPAHTWAQKGDRS